jgi:hypothetical protein
MQIKKNPDKYLQEAQGPLRLAECMILHGSDTTEGRYARFFAHQDLCHLLSKVAGYRKAERPLKLYLYMLEQKGIQEPPPWPPKPNRGIRQTDHSNNQQAAAVSFHRLRP